MPRSRQRKRLRRLVANTAGTVFVAAGGWLFFTSLDTASDLPAPFTDHHSVVALMGAGIILAGMFIMHLGCRHLSSAR